MTIARYIKINFHDCEPVFELAALPVSFLNLQEFTFDAEVTVAVASLGGRRRVVPVDHLSRQLRPQQLVSNAIIEALSEALREANLGGVRERRQCHGLVVIKLSGQGDRRQKHTRDDETNESSH